MNTSINELRKKNIQTLIKKFVSVKNNQAIEIQSVPILNYTDFYTTVVDIIKSNDTFHCVNYYAYPQKNNLQCIIAIADDETKNILLLSHIIENAKKKKLESITQSIEAMHIFEREIAENFGIYFENHPWLKPIRYPHNREDTSQNIYNYPFYEIEGSQLHQIGVGPIHAGVIEPGHFRFTCHGETVHHLEIQLGWQHRGIETLFLQKTKLFQRNTLAENIAGDTSIGHSVVFCSVIEALNGSPIPQKLELERTIAMELERIAMHTADLANLSIGIAYQLSASVYAALRTPIINFLQSWCGNRFGKSLIRANGTFHPFSLILAENILKLLHNYEKKFDQMSQKLFSLPSAILRLKGIGNVTKTQAQQIGAVGMVARSCGIIRDIRASHPSMAYVYNPYFTSITTTGDVFSRALLRRMEIKKSIRYIQSLIHLWKQNNETIPSPILDEQLSLKKEHIAFSLAEGWRGEIVHSAITDSTGKIIHYKIKDPSLHNWKALEIALRELEISDFPINNKSFNLSYCGNDL